MTKAGSSLKLNEGNKPLWLVLELTYKCPLKCPWCSNPLDFENYTNELSTDEWKSVLREARQLGSLQLGFSGGEPMVRPDLEELVGEADQLGFYTNLITSGMGLSLDRLKDLQKRGLKQIQLSVQHSDKAKNDALVGVESFERKMACMEAIKSLGFPVVLNVPVTKYNIKAIPDIIKLAEDFQIEFVEFANVQYYNWALLNRDELLPTIEDLREAEELINRERERLGNKTTLLFVIPDYFDGRPKACMNGWGAIHLTIAPDGSALPCQEAQTIKGLEFPNVKEASLEWIWRKSSAFNAYRGNDWMKGACVECDEKEKDFGGCRCQAYALTGDAANPDPACSKSEHFSMITSAIENARITSRPALPLVMRTRGALGNQIKSVCP